MARRIVIEWDCPGIGCRKPLHYDPPRKHRRVLDPNSFVDEVAHAVMAWTWTIDAVPDMESPIEGLDLANRILDALAGGEG